MIAQEMGVILTKHAEIMTAKCWADFIQKLENSGLYVVIETETNGRVLSPFGGLMPMPCKGEKLTLMTAAELEIEGLSLGHHIVTKKPPKNVVV